MRPPGIIAGGGLPDGGGWRGWLRRIMALIFPRPHKS
jgi:hypothetical protein